MIWAKHDKESYADLDSIAFRDNEHLAEAYGRVLLDMTAPQGLPDGTYNLTCDRGPQTVTTSRVIVKDGRFIPENIHEATLDTACRSFRIDPDAVRSGKTPVPDHKHIDAVTYCPSRNTLVLQLGP